MELCEEKGRHEGLQLYLEHKEERIRGDLKMKNEKMT